jgi:hypothetical protein
MSSPRHVLSKRRVSERCHIINRQGYPRCVGVVYICKISLMESFVGAHSLGPLVGHDALDEEKSHI